ncbi:hypothetical protein U1Q18_050752, partial [Sarracenia purpurea var. burkii]
MQTGYKVQLQAEGLPTDSGMMRILVCKLIQRFGFASVFIFTRGGVRKRVKDGFQ